MEAENQLGSIKQWYKRATVLNRNWRKSKWEKERLRGKKEQMGGVSRLKKIDLIYFYFSFIFYFIFNLFFYFLFLEQLRLGLISHAVTSVTIR